MAAQRLIHWAIVTSRVAGLPLVGLAYSPRGRQKELKAMCKMLGLCP
jgi:hypothetical protein